MRTHYFIIGVLLCMHPLYANAVTLKETMDMAVEQHPMLKISELQIEGAQGELNEQSSYAYNPELSVQPQRRRINGGGSSNDYYITLSQGIELAGKQGYRSQVAESALEAVTLDADAMRQQIKVNAARTFVELFFSKRELIWRNQQAITLFNLNKAITRQMELGEANQLDVNLSQSSLTQAIYAETQAKQLHAMNMSRYLMAIGNSADIKAVEPELPRPLNNWHPQSDPVEMALNSRPDIAAKRKRLSQYTAQANLADAERVPDVTIDFTTARESGDNLYSVGFTMPIPVLNSHNGAYQSALSQQQAKMNELKWLEQRVKLEVEEALYNHTTAMRSLAAVQRVEGNNSSSEDIKLAKAAFDAGELNIEELVIHINQALESRINTMAIVKEGWLARIRLAEALGHPEFILEGIQ